MAVLVTAIHAGEQRERCRKKPGIDDAMARLDSP
jgi:hypothetical protein